jgi:hypothetical protein
MNFATTLKENTIDATRKFALPSKNLKEKLPKEKEMSEESTTECLYYRAYRSFLLQDTDFKTNFELLAYQYFQYPETFKVFSQNDAHRLIRMQEAFKTGTFNLFKGIPLDFSTTVLPKMDDVDQPHQDLVRKVYESGSLEKYTGPIKSVCPEYPVFYGNIDLMAISGDCAYVIEFKTDTANHSIIGQVTKYYIGLGLQLNLKYFNDIKIITVCPGYDQVSLKGLKQIGATTLMVDPPTLKLSELL